MQGSSLLLDKSPPDAPGPHFSPTQLLGATPTLCSELFSFPSKPGPSWANKSLSFPPKAEQRQPFLRRIVTNSKQRPGTNDKSSTTRAAFSKQTFLMLRELQTQPQVTRASSQAPGLPGACVQFGHRCPAAGGTRFCSCEVRPLTPTSFMGSLVKIKEHVPDKTQLRHLTKLLLFLDCACFHLDPLLLGTSYHVGQRTCV